MFSQCAFLDKKLLGYDNFTVFKSRYAVMYNIEKGGYNIQIPKYYVNLDELEYKLKHFSYRVRKKECLDLPDKMYIQRHTLIYLQNKDKAYDQELNSICVNSP